MKGELDQLMSILLIVMVLMAVLLFAIGVGYISGWFDPTKFAFKTVN